MTIRSRFVQLAFLPIAALLLTGCVAQSDVRSGGSRGGAAQTDLGWVAVFPFQGPHGELFAGRVSYELLQHGFGTITQQRIHQALAADGLSADEMYREGGRERLMELAEGLGADTVVIGSVTPREREENVLSGAVDRFRSSAALKVERARAELVRVADGATLGTAVYEKGREYGIFTPNYRDAARGLVETVVAGN